MTVFYCVRYDLEINTLLYYVMYVYLSSFDGSIIHLIAKMPFKTSVRRLTAFCALEL